MQTEATTTAGSNNSITGTNGGAFTPANHEAKMDVVSMIDRRNQTFIDNAKAQLRDLDHYTTEALEWLMMEHYQFSFQNTEFLATAAEQTGAFDTGAVKQELIRNCEEENGHAAMYKAALKKIGCDVESRVEFPSTTKFLATIDELVEREEPSAVLGTMFATETAAIFEHEVFRDVSVEVIKRRNVEKKGKPLVAFHDMHLSGVEQSHRDELGIFLRGIRPDQSVAPKEGERPTLHPQQALAGAEQAIGAMELWWADLFAAIKAKSENRVVA